MLTGLMVVVLPWAYLPVRRGEATTGDHLRSAWPGVIWLGRRQGAPVVDHQVDHQVDRWCPRHRRGRWRCAYSKRLSSKCSPPPAGPRLAPGWALWGGRRAPEATLVRSLKAQ